MEFLAAKVKGVKADVVAGRITLTFSVPLSDLFDAQQLAQFAEADMGKVELVVRSKQMVMADLFSGARIETGKGEWKAAEQPPSGSPLGNAERNSPQMAAGERGDLGGE
ncbi:hypothetical protein CCP3SC15_2590004 [Gammaproteobacteria bacterium]